MSIYKKQYILKTVLLCVVLT